MVWDMSLLLTAAQLSGVRGTGQKMRVPAQPGHLKYSPGCHQPMHHVSAPAACSREGEPVPKRVLSGLNASQLVVWPLDGPGRATLQSIQCEALSQLPGFRLRIWHLPHAPG